MKIGCNLHKKVIELLHSEITRFSDSAYKSVCPECKEGILFVARDRETFKLLRHDICMFCGQRFKYIDKVWEDI